MDHLSPSKLCCWCFFFITTVLLWTFSAYSQLCVALLFYSHFSFVRCLSYFWSTCNAVIHLEFFRSESKEEKWEWRNKKKGFSDGPSWMPDNGVIRIWKCTLWATVHCWMFDFHRQPNNANIEHEMSMFIRINQKKEKRFALSKIGPKIRYFDWQKTRWLQNWIYAFFVGWKSIIFKIKM